MTCNDAHLIPKTKIARRTVSLAFLLIAIPISIVHLCTSKICFTQKLFTRKLRSLFTQKLRSLVTATLLFDLHVNRINRFAHLDVMHHGNASRALPGPVTGLRCHGSPVCPIVLYHATIHSVQPQRS